MSILGIKRTSPSFIENGFISYLEDKSIREEQRRYTKPVIELLKDFSLTLDPTLEYEVAVLMPYCLTTLKQSRLLNVSAI